MCSQHKVPGIHLCAECVIRNVGAAQNYAVRCQKNSKAKTSYHFLRENWTIRQYADENLEQYIQASLMIHRQLLAAKCRWSTAEDGGGLRFVGAGKSCCRSPERQGKNGEYGTLWCSLPELGEHSTAHRLSQAWASQGQPSPGSVLCFSVNSHWNIPRSPGSLHATWRCNHNSQAPLFVNLPWPRVKSKLQREG